MITEKELREKMEEILTEFMLEATGYDVVLADKGIGDKYVKKLLALQRRKMAKAKQKILEEFRQNVSPDVVVPGLTGRYYSIDKVEKFLPHALDKIREKTLREVEREAKKLQSENRNNMLGDIDNMHKVGKEDAYIHILNLISKLKTNHE